MKKLLSDELGEKGARFLLEHGTVSKWPTTVACTKVGLEGLRKDWEVIYPNANEYSSDPCFKSHYLKDTDEATGGVDSVPLFFLATEGWSDGFSTMGGSVYQNDGLLFGDGKLRYFFMCGCNVLAHGPKERGTDYTKPGDYAPAQVLVGNHADAPARWGNAIDPRLRMICAGSSKICDTPDTYDPLKNSIERLRSEAGRVKVAEALVMGLSVDANQVPLCMARGGDKLNSSPIYNDLGFTTDINSYGNGGYFHLGFPVWRQDRPAPSFEVRDALGQELKLPVIPVVPMADLTTVEQEKWQKWLNLPEGVDFRVLGRAKAIAARGVEAKPLGFSGNLSDFGAEVENDLLDYAGEWPAALVNASGSGVPLRPPLGKGTRTELRADIVKSGNSVASTFSSRWALKGELALVRKLDISRWLGICQWPANPQKANVLGPGGIVRVDIDPTSAKVTYFEATVRPVDDHLPPTCCESCGLNTAREKALERLAQQEGRGIQEVKQHYQEDKSAFDFGFKEEGYWVGQTQMVPTYHFRFVPEVPAQIDDFPPRTIEMTACKPGCLTAEPPQPNPP